MTHVLIAADVIPTLAMIAFVVVVIALLVRAAASDQIRLRRYRRNYHLGFWHNDQPTDLLLDDVQEIATQTFSNNDNADLSIYKSHDNSNDATQSSESILGLNGGTATGGLDDSSGFGALGEAAGDYLSSDYSSDGYTDYSDWTSSNDSSND